MSVAEWVDTYGIHHWRILWSSYRKLAGVGFEPTTTEFRSDPLTDWAARPWVKLAHRANFVQLLQFHFGYYLCHSPRLFSLNFWIYIYIYIGLSAYPQKHQPSLFFSKPLINQKIVKVPPFFPIPFSQFVPLYFGFLQSSLKSNFSVNPIILKNFHP